jgi:hypothetical protein
MQGNFGEFVADLTEYLSPQALRFAGHPDCVGSPTCTGGHIARSKSVLFVNAMILPKPQYPLAIEVVKPQGMVLNPVLFNFRLGYFLKLNFDLSYLKFNGGWDLLGTFQFRTNYYPRR